MFETYHRQTNFAVGIDDEHGTDGESDALLVDVVQVLLVDHIVLECDLPVGIRNYWKLDLRLGNLVDVFDPASMTVQIIGTLEVYC